MIMILIALLLYGLGAYQSYQIVRIVEKLDNPFEVEMSTYGKLYITLAWPWLVTLDVVDFVKTKLEERYG